MPRPTPAAAAIGRTAPTVNYVTSRGQAVDAVVTGSGGAADQLNLMVRTLGVANRAKTNVPKRTAANQTGVWY